MMGSKNSQANKIVEPIGYPFLIKNRFQSDSNFDFRNRNTKKLETIKNKTKYPSSTIIAISADRS
ncbi:hypothetical protein [Fodinibius saliphilus]|uniref:hypothetical protein n=1 Tax=Fodinibius saliphilus TaxID=1920650 RepID=UPI0011096E99|nr:hypothetical protein [Fodinibius saliphilus]